MCKEEKEVSELFRFDGLTDNADMYKRWTKCCLLWYVRKANKNKKLFYILSFLTIILPVISTICLGINDDMGKLLFHDKAILLHIVPLILSGSTSVVTGLLAILNAGQKWNIYRTSAEYLKTEYAWFNSTYPNPTRNEVQMYMSKINDFMNQQHRQWQKVSFSDKEDAKSDIDVETKALEK